VGVGVGGREDEYRAAGVPFAGRFARLDEQVDVMNRVWRGETVVDGLPPIGPAPVQPGGPPLLSAAMGPKSLARTARWAAGLAGFDLGPDPEGVDALFRRAEAAWVEAGRTERPMLTTSTWFALGDGAAERLYGYAHHYLSNFGERAASGLAKLCRLSDPGVLRDTIAAVRATGCDELILVPTTADPAELDRLLAAIGESAG
jgi:alkanesulfonate monooxygenase SsuD/methylene tetrahydromethanopterin reductase-like flavin-dependent oxidoreductase (luciferase family)